MKKRRIVEVAEQDAVYDGDIDLMPASLLMSVANHNCYGGTKSDMQLGIDEGELENPRLYKVRIIIEVEEYES